MICEKCGKETEDVLIGDLTNILKDLSVICKGCRVDYRMVKGKDGSLKGYSREKVNLFEVMQQVNPDVLCDFCNKPDPIWLYDLKMEPMVFGDKEIDLGTRWTACDPCSKEAAEGSPIGTTLRMGVHGNITNILQIHGAVMEHISNKRPYVHSEEDGVIKPL